MTESNQGPATPGTAERDQLDLRDWGTCPCGSPSGPEFRYGLCDPCAEQTPASALLRMGQYAGIAALAAPKSIPEIERLKAENASLLESLRARRVELEGYRKMALLREGEANELRAALAAAEQRAEAAEKELARLVRRLESTLAIIEQRSADCYAEAMQAFANGRYRSALTARSEGYQRSAVLLRAALHDEERRPQEEVPLREEK